MKIHFKYFSMLNYGLYTDGENGKMQGSPGILQEIINYIPE